MTELENRLNKLTLRIDHLGMRVEQSLVDAWNAVESGDVEGGRKVDADDSVIDREEVEIEQECIRLLALYQPAAVDLRTLCTIIKINSDLERIADLAASMARRTKHVVSVGLSVAESPHLRALEQDTADLLGRTVRMLSHQNADVARAVIDGDERIDNAYSDLVQSVLRAEDQHVGGAEVAMTVINLAKA
ncbi:MAG: hypothetical protein KGY99_01875, partial [Phycisphaerae bacterium]|nr:hypothetical protein [Phycisphaerae bacterium]